MTQVSTAASFAPVSGAAVAFPLAVWLAGFFNQEAQCIKTL